MSALGDLAASLFRSPEAIEREAYARNLTPAAQGAMLAALAQWDPDADPTTFPKALKAGKFDEPHRSVLERLIRGRGELPPMADSGGSDAGWSR